jgi:glyoxylase-like metal-dependent hydrolase (beta-lactamase superfamily II)
MSDDHRHHHHAEHGSGELAHGHDGVAGDHAHSNDVAASEDPGTPPAVAPMRIAEGVVELDTMLGGWTQVTAGYLLEGPRPVLVETGAQSSVPTLLAALDAIGLGPHDLAGVVVTHIHLDHAGGVGDVAAAFPDATVYVHEKGARHLADPTRLVSSAAIVYGDLLDSLYGRLTPTPADRLHVLEDLEEIDLGGGRSLCAVDSPGHAKHHLGLHDSLSGILFAGDAVGVRLPDIGVLRPATPPPDFDLHQARASLRRFAERRPVGIALAHYGLLQDPEGLLAEADEVLVDWAEVAEAAWRSGTDIADALSASFALTGVAPEHLEKAEVLSGVHSNAAGLRRFFETQERPAGAAGSSPA